MSRPAYLILQTMHNGGIYYSLHMVYILCKKWAVMCASAEDSFEANLEEDAPRGEHSIEEILQG